jgi:hypothetical protein
MTYNYLRVNLAHPSTPPELRDPKNWPEQARKEWGDDEGVTTARKYLAELQKGFRLARKAIDEFKPDFVLVFADDQYENLREDCLPPFTVFAIDEVYCDIWASTSLDGVPNPNVRFNPPVTVKGHLEAARHIVRELIKKGFDVASSWRLPHGPSYGHSMTWTCDFLDLDQRGFYPVVPFAVNTYGVDLRIPYPENPSPSRLGRKLEGMPVTPPPAPVPWRCYDLGKAVAKIIEASPWRAVIVGSASWSHASLNTKSRYLWPDMESDRARREELFRGEQRKWRDLAAEQLNDAGQHEFLNWICLAGAMEGRKAELLSLSEAYLFNSNRMVVVFPEV